MSELTVQEQYDTYDHDHSFATEDEKKLIRYSNCSGCIELERDELADENFKLQSEVARLKSGLEFYAKPEHWSRNGRMNNYVFNQSDSDDLRVHTEDDVLHVAGAKARQTLANDKAE